MINLSVILPIMNEEENIQPLFNELLKTLNHLHQKSNLTFEIIAIDDGSTDTSLQILKRLAQEISQLRVFSFRGNRGQSSAFDAGFRAAEGEIIITMDADLQNDPNDIEKLVDEINKGFDFVTGYRVNRQDGVFLRKIPSWIANKIIRGVTKTKVRDLGCSLKAYKKEIAKDLLLYGEMHRFISVLAEIQGAKISEIPVNHRPRTHGESKYNLSRTFKVMFDLITVWYLMNYQTKPIYVFGGLSVLSFFAGLLLSGYVLYEKIFENIFVHRNPLFIIATLLFTFSVQFIVFGVLAEILIRTYFESQKKRPYSFKYIHEGSSPCAES